MDYRLDKEGLFARLSDWNSFLKKKVRLVACGGTALTLLGVKPSTKDIDLIVPQLNEYEYLVNVLKDLGYKSASGWGFSRGDGFVFDIFRGNRVHTTELIESPLKKGNNIPIKEFTYLSLGVLNYNDLIITKLFRATAVDIEDCLALIRARREEIQFERLFTRFKRTASFEVAEDAVLGNLKHFMEVLKKERLYHG